MKKILAVLICTVMLLGCVTLFASCNSNNDSESTSTADTSSQAVTTGSETTAGVTDNTTAADTVTAPVETTAATTDTINNDTTNADTDEQTTVPEVTTGTDITTSDETADTEPEATETQPEFGKDDVVINSAADLIAFHDSIYEDEKEYFEITVYFTADINLEGYDWIPLDGFYLDTVTFNGLGHTIKNLTITDTEDYDLYITSQKSYGFGFIGNSCYDLTFKDLNFDNVNITTYERHAGTLIGEMSGGYVTVENVDVSNLTINGFMMNNDESGHKIAFRNAGYIGVVFGGEVTFEDCSLDSAYISGFHNLAAFVGYDGANAVNEYCFTHCSASNITLEFSYCQSATYSADKTYKFVSVFYNGVLWTDNTATLFAAGETNSYNNIKYIDHMTGDEYTPDNFKSWTEDSPSYLKYIENGASSFKNID